jgi:hypothetical protein
MNGPAPHLDYNHYLAWVEKQDSNLLMKKNLSLSYLTSSASSFLFQFYVVSLGHPVAAYTFSLVFPHFYPPFHPSLNNMF